MTTITMTTTPPTKDNKVSLDDPLTLPCGVVLPNRLAKAAMTEGLATAGGIPTPALEQLYRIWANGGAGLLITGNVQIDRHHLERPGNVIIEGPPNDELMIAMKKWATTATNNNTTHCWVQISHAGRQVQKKVNPHPKGPSAVQLAIPGGQFGEPIPLTIDEIKDIVSRFAKCAQTCQMAGFTGIQIHAAHGYLLSTFLSPLVNTRTDEYGGKSLENRARILLEVVQETRKLVGPAFPIAVKLNSADFQKGGFNFEDSLQVVQWLEEATVDLIEISGGTYEQPGMMGLEGLEPKEVQSNVAQSTKEREAYFVDFANAMQAKVKVPLMVTGGFRTKAAMSSALKCGAADLIGLGRPMCVMTDAPKRLLKSHDDNDIDGLEVLPSYEENLGLVPWWLSFMKWFLLVKAVDGFSILFWFYEQLYLLGHTGKTDPNLGPYTALINVETRADKLLKERSQKL